MRAKRCQTCAADLVEVRGRFAQIALYELNRDPSWERVVVGLATLFAEPPLNPL